MPPLAKLTIGRFFSRTPTLLGTRKPSLPGSLAYQDAYLKFKIWGGFLIRSFAVRYLLVKWTRCIGFQQDHHVSKITLQWCVERTLWANHVYQIHCIEWIDNFSVLFVVVSLIIGTSLIKELQEWNIYKKGKISLGLLNEYFCSNGNYPAASLNKNIIYNKIKICECIDFFSS